MIGNGKTFNSAREVPMSQCLKKILKEYLKTNMNIKYLFTNAKGNFISPATINAQFKRICKDAGIRTTTYIFDRNDNERNKIRTIHLKSSSCNCHLLRHTFATRCIESGISPVVLQRILGHSSIDITLRNLYISIQSI